MTFISVLLQMFWKKFYRSFSGVVLYQPCEFCPNRWLKKKYSKIFFSEAIRGMKLKLCINVYDISLCITHIFLLLLPLLWQLKVSIYLQWEEWKSAFISVLLQIFWQKFYWNVSGVVVYQLYAFCPNHWFWLVAMATERLNFWERKKNIQKR